MAIATLGARLADYTGTVSAGCDQNNMFTQAIRMITDKLPSSLLETGFTAIPIVENANAVIDIVSGRFLRASRAEEVSAQTRPCRVVTPDDFQSMSSTASIFRASALNPIVTVYRRTTANRQVQVYPIPIVTGEAYIYVFPYLVDTGAGTSDLLGHANGLIVDNTTTPTIYFPDEAYELVILTAALLIKQYQLAELTHDEEDTEIVATMQSEIEMIVGLIANEESRLGLRDDV
jgi:hypothetical protein